MPSVLDEPLRQGAVHGAERTRAALVHGFFRLLEERSIRWIVLGRTAERADDSRGDVDLVVEPRALAELPRLVWMLCEREGLRLVRVFRHEWNAFNFGLSWRDASRGLQLLQFDVCSDLGRDARRFFSSEELLAGRRETVSGSGVFRPDPALGFATYLVKKVEKQDLTPEAMTYLRARWREAPAQGIARLRRFWDEAELDVVRRAFESDDWLRLRDALPGLRAALHSRLRRSPRDWLREVARLAERSVNPVGYWVAFLGPDGAGKSTLIERVSAELAPLFVGVEDHHLRPHLLSRAGRSRETVTNPHGQAPRGRAASLAKLALWWADCNLGFAFEILPSLVRARLVLFDRHFSDLLVDPHRYRYGASRRIAALVCASTVQPSLFVLADAPVQVIHARKREVTEVEVERQRRAYSRLLDRLPDSVTVGTARVLDEVVAEVVDTILARLERRTLRRLGIARARGERASTVNLDESRAAARS